MSTYRAENVGGGMMAVSRDGVVVATVPQHEAFELMEELAEKDRETEKR